MPDMISTFTPAPPGWRIWHATPDAGLDGHGHGVFWVPLGGWVTDATGPHPGTFDPFDGQWVDLAEDSRSETFLALTPPGDPCTWEFVVEARTNWGVRHDDCPLDLAGATAVVRAAGETVPLVVGTHR